MKFFKVIIFLFFISIIILKADENKFWPYSKSLSYLYFTDSTGKKINNIFRRTFATYDTAGRELSRYVEQNSTPLDTNGFRFYTTDTLQYDLKGRLVLKKTYYENSSPSPEKREYIDSFHLSGTIIYYLVNQNWKPSSWEYIYKNKNGKDSLILNGKGGIPHSNISKKQYFYYTGKQLDSIVTNSFYNSQWTSTYSKFYYSDTDTVMEYLYDNLRNQYGKRFSIYNGKGLLIREESTYSGSQSFKIYSYNLTGQLTEKKSYSYDFDNKEYRLNGTSEKKTYNSYNILERSFQNFYSKGLWTNGNLYVYNYTLRKPTAAFAISSPDICIGDSIIFTDESIDAQKYIWYFGDGNTSSSKTPVHTFLKPGNYNVKLIVTANSGLTDSIIRTVSVLPVPDARFSVVKDTTAGTENAFIFIPEDTTQNTYTWLLNDTTFLSNDKIGRYSFPQDENKFKISLLITTNAGCTGNSDTTLSIKTSVKEATSIENNIKVYPNPFTETLELDFLLNKASTVCISLTDISGKELYNYQITSLAPGKYLHTLNHAIKNLNTGVYFIKFYTDSFIINKKIIKNKL